MCISCNVYISEQRNKLLLSCNVNVRAQVLLNLEPVWDPTRAYWSTSDVAVCKPGQLTGKIYTLRQTTDRVLSWYNLIESMLARALDKPIG